MAHALIYSGSSSQPFWDGTNLARNDAIIVSFNYRLGALGWMSMDHLSSDLKGSGNLGLLDQIGKVVLVAHVKGGVVDQGVNNSFFLFF